MKNRTHGALVMGLLILAFAVCSCAGESCNCGVDEDNTGSDGTDSSNDPTGTGQDVPEGGALLSFCNPVSMTGGVPAELQLVVGEGAEQVTLSAVTLTCSNRPGEACTEIPTGAAVPFAVLNADGVEQYATTFEILPDTAYGVSTNVEGTEIVLQQGEIPVVSNCAIMECLRQFYNDVTCAVDDPCGWAGNGTCDAVSCQSEANPMFDDSADCG